MTINPILTRNLEMLTGTDEGTLRYAQGRGRESMGSATYQDALCSGANFYYDGTNGEIKWFGNDQEVPQYWKKFHRGTLQIAWMKESIKIVKLLCLDEITMTSNRLAGLKEPNTEAIRMLEQTVEAFNQVKKK